MKHCISCDVSKPESEFGKNAAKEDGLNTYCLICVRAYAKKRRDAKPKVQRINKTLDMAAYQREWRKSNQERARLHERARAEKNPERYRLRYEQKMKRLRGEDYVVNDPANRSNRFKGREGSLSPEEARVRHNSRRKFRRAVKAGKLPPLPCLVCGSKDVEGHHPDYDHPLDVVWLCKEHHVQTHKRSFIA